MAAEPRLNVFQDAVDHLADFLGGSAMDAEQRIVRKAIQNAYNRFTNERSWQYLYTHGRINLVDSYSTGTMTFDLTGGAHERLVTFSTALSTAVQSWAKFGRILLQDATSGAELVYDIDDYKTTTTVTLKEGLCPTGDVSATEFTLYRNVYPLPADFRRLSEPVPEWQFNAWYIPPQEWMFLERHEHAEGSPMAWTIMPDPDKNGGYAIFVYPYPDENETLDFIYQRYARTMKYTGYESAARTGTITVSASSTAVTGSGTSWTSDMAGSYMRFINGTTVPDGLGGLNPFSEQRKIRSVTTTTALVLDTAVDNAYTAKAFCISDPVDVPDPFWEPFCRCCEWQLAMTGRIKDVDAKFGYYQAALRRAFELDAVMEIPRMFGADGIGSTVVK